VDTSVDRDGPPAVEQVDDGLATLAVSRETRAPCVAERRVRVRECVRVVRARARVRVRARVCVRARVVCVCVCVRVCVSESRVCLLHVAENVCACAVGGDASVASPLATALVW